MPSNTLPPLAVPSTLGAERVEIFREIYIVFLVLGALVGVVVIGYTMYNAYKYRDDGRPASEEADRPQLGELPSGSGGGRKLFLSFFISAVIVVGLILWTYNALLYVEAQPAQTEDAVEVDVEGYQFGWEFQYENGVTTQNELRVPEDERVLLTLTSRDVWHTFGIPEKRVKADAIPGQTSETWFETGTAGEYRAECFELCGAGHSAMDAEVIVMEREEYEAWLAEAEQEQAEEGDAENGSEEGEADETDGEEVTEEEDGTESIERPARVVVDERTDGAVALEPLANPRARGHA